jgi:hypothetical protein
VKNLQMDVPKTSLMEVILISIKLTTVMGGGR